jgi:xanthine dehydrogenase YagR molybdenum-binding subunit
MSIAAPEPKANMGQPIPRYDAVAKVTGKAEYAADTALVRPAFAYLVTSSIARGRIDGFDLAAAKQVRGVIDIVTHENAEKLKDAKLFSNGGHASTTIQPLKSAAIAQEGQIVAVVLAESFEAAREAAHLVKVHRRVADRELRFTGHDVRPCQGTGRAIQGRSEGWRLCRGFRQRRSQT